MLVAANPQFIFFSASVNNDNLANALCSVVLVMLVYGLTIRTSWRYPALLGVMTGLAILSKPSALALIALVLAGLMWRSYGARSWSCLVREVFAFLLPILALTGWWFVRNWQLYEDPLALVAHTSFGFRYPTMGLLDVVINEAQGMWWSYWAVFGTFDILAPAYMYSAFTIIGLVVLTGLTLGLVRVIKCGTYKRWFDASSSEARRAVVVALMLGWIVLLGLALIRWTLMVPASQGRLLFPGAAAAAVLMALGVWQYPLVRKPLSGVIAMALVAFAIILPFNTIAPAYARPPLIAADQSIEIANPVSVTFDQKLELMGYEIDEALARPGEEVLLTLHWRVLSSMNRDYSMYVHVSGVQGQELAHIDTYPMGGAYRTSQLSPGAIYSETIPIEIPPDAIAPGIGSIDVGLYELATMLQLPAYDGQMNLVHAAPAGTFRIVGDAKWDSEPQYAICANFDQQIELSGYDLLMHDDLSGHSIEGSLYWTALSTPARDYSVFVHLVSQGKPVAQCDALLNPDYPTSTWVRGDAFKEDFELQVPSDVTDGQYRLIVGLYDLASGERLSVGATDSVPLSTILVE